MARAEEVMTPGSLAAALALVENLGSPDGSNDEADDLFDRWGTEQLVAAFAVIIRLAIAVQDEPVTSMLIGRINMQFEMVAANPNNGIEEFRDIMLGAVEAAGAGLDPFEWRTGQSRPLQDREVGAWLLTAMGVCKQVDLYYKRPNQCIESIGRGLSGYMSYLGALPPSPDAPGGPGLVAGPTYGKQDAGKPIALRGFNFEFRPPAGWGFIRGYKEGSPEVVAWRCMDETGLWPPTLDAMHLPTRRATATIRLEPCLDSSAEGWLALRRELVVAADDWKVVDDATMYAERLYINGDDEKVVLGLSHLFASEPGGPLDRHLGVEGVAAPDDKSTLQKLFNELRRRT